MSTASTVEMCSPEDTRLKVFAGHIRQYDADSGFGQADVSEEFVTNVRNVGIIEPVQAVVCGDDIIVFDGVRRVEAARRGDVEVPVLLRDIDPVDVYLENVGTHLSVWRKDVSDSDRRKALHRYMQEVGYESFEPVLEQFGLLEERDQRCETCWRKIEHAGARAMHEKHCDPWDVDLPPSFSDK